MRCRMLSLLLAVLFTVHCSAGSKKTQLIAEIAPAIPVGLIVEAEIEGSILNLELSEPVGLAVDRSGQIYLSDAGNNRIVRFDSNLVPRSDTRGYGGEEGGLDRPAFLWSDNSLNLIVADAGNRRLAWFDRHLNFADELEFYDEEDPLKYGEIVSVATTDYGELWAVDREIGRIAVFDNVGDFSSFVGDFGASGGQLAQPGKILRYGDDGFVVCDAGNGRLVYYDSYGNFDREFIDDLLEYPIAMTFAATGMWLLDGRSGRLVYSGEGEERLFVTGPVLAGTKRPLREPTDILALKDGRLLIADTGNNRLLVCRPYFE